MTIDGYLSIIDGMKTQALWPLRACLVSLFTFAVLGQVLGIGVYVTKFAEGPEQVRALLWLAIGLVTLVGIEALALSVWALTSRYCNGTLFTAGSTKWLSVVTISSGIFVLPSAGLLLAVVTSKEGIVPVMVAALVALTMASAAAALTLAILSQAFKEALAAKLELAEVI